MAYSSLALLGHSLAAYISVLDRERLRKLTTGSCLTPRCGSADSSAVYAHKISTTDSSHGEPGYLSKGCI
ncbi:hypothetical protein NQZ68_016798 [Dissostichus eleginoides]|nr:hypothetical protein NQZ68_016798 [Dissostichus eleginoides]